MKLKHSIFFLLLLTFVACVKEEPEPFVNQIPPGSTPFTDSDILFVPYTTQSPNFKDQFGNDLTLNFKERKRTEEYFAWDQTYFNFSTDVTLEIEMRLRYLQSDVSKKTLALYMPYYDNGGTLRNNLFEMPIDFNGIETGFFKNLIQFDDTLTVAGTEYYNVYSVNELVSTDPTKDGVENFSKIVYNRTFGIIQMHLKNGVIWTLQ